MPWILACALLLASDSLYAQKRQESDSERTVALARRGAGFRVGAWNADRPVATDRTFVESLLFEGYFQKGLDRHLALESTAAVWRRTGREKQPLTNNTIETRASIVPLLTALKLYPVTVPEDRVEPYVLGGVGFALGIEEVSGNAIGGGGTDIQTGFGFKGGAGLEARFSRAFGILAGGRYQWIKFADTLGSEDTFKGFGLEGGITYRFQF